MMALHFCGGVDEVAKPCLRVPIVVLFQEIGSLRSFKKLMTWSASSNELSSGMMMAKSSTKTNAQRIRGKV